MNLGSRCSEAATHSVSTSAQGLLSSQQAFQCPWLLPRCSIDLGAQVTQPRDLLLTNPSGPRWLHSGVLSAKPRSRDPKHEPFRLRAEPADPRPGAAARGCSLVEPGTCLMFSPKPPLQVLEGEAPLSLPTSCESHRCPYSSSPEQLAISCHVGGSRGARRASPRQQESQDSQRGPSFV